MVHAKKHAPHAEHRLFWQTSSCSHLPGLILAPSTGTEIQLSCMNFSWELPGLFFSPTGFDNNNPICAPRSINGGASILDNVDAFNFDSGYRFQHA